MERPPDTRLCVGQRSSVVLAMSPDQIVGRIHRASERSLDAALKRPHNIKQMDRAFRWMNCAHRYVAVLYSKSTNPGWFL